MNPDKMNNYLTAPLVVTAYFGLVSIISLAVGENIITVINYVNIGLLTSLGFDRGKTIYGSSK